MRYWLNGLSNERDCQGCATENCLIWIEFAITESLTEAKSVDFQSSENLFIKSEKRWISEHYAQHLTWFIPWLGQLKLVTVRLLNSQTDNKIERFVNQCSLCISSHISIHWREIWMLFGEHEYTRNIYSVFGKVSTGDALVCTTSTTRVWGDMKTTFSIVLRYGRIVLVRTDVL